MEIRSGSGFLVVALFLVGCGGGGGSNGGDTPPAIETGIQATFPVSGATDVGTKHQLLTIYVTFKEPVAAATVDTSSFFINGVNGTVTLKGQTAIFTPVADLAYNQTYTATVTTAVHTSSGAPLPGTYTWSFTTQPRPSPVLFVTSVAGTGNLGSWPGAGTLTGVAAGDAVCQARAAAVGLAGTFRAVLADDQNDAYCRLLNLTGKVANNCGQAALPSPPGPWIRTDGWPGLMMANTYRGREEILVTALNLDEAASSVPPDSQYFAGIGGSWTAPPASCSNWSASDNSWVKAHLVNFSSWMGSSSIFCSSSTRLLCAQSEVGPGLPRYSTYGKRVFQTSSYGNGNLGSWPEAAGNSGIAAGDAICRTRAAILGLENAARFKAWLSDSTTDAQNRFGSDGPWVRLDGLVVATNKNDLTDGLLSVAINLKDNANFGQSVVWTGSARDGTRTANNCANWTSDSSSTTGTVGISSVITGPWSDSSPWSCGSAAVSLYCLED